MQQRLGLGAEGKKRRVQPCGTFLQPEGCAPGLAGHRASRLALRADHGNVKEVELTYERNLQG
jgi:hypothetical protein